MFGSSFPFHFCVAQEEKIWGLTREGGENKIFTFSQKSSSFFHIWCFWGKEYLIQFVCGVEMLKKKKDIFFSCLEEGSTEGGGKGKGKKEESAPWQKCFQVG